MANGNFFPWPVFFSTRAEVFIFCRFSALWWTVTAGTVSVRVGKYRIFKNTFACKPFLGQTWTGHNCFPEWGKLFSKMEKRL